MTNWNRRDGSEERTIDFTTRARLGGLTNSARNNPQEYTAAARERANSLAKWLDQVPPEVPEPERTRRAEAMRRLHYVQLGVKSGQARRGQGKKR